MTKHRAKADITESSHSKKTEVSISGRMWKIGWQWRSRCRRFCGYYVNGLIHRAERDHIFLMAGGLAFSVIFCIIPLVLILFWVLGQFLHSGAVINEVSLWFDRVIPYPELAEFAKRVVTERIQEFTGFRHTAGIIGLVALLFTSSALFSSLRTILNASAGIRRTEHIVVGKLLDFGLVMLVVLYFLTTTSLLPGLDLVQKVANRVEILQFMRLGPVSHLIYESVSFVVLTIASFLIYQVVPFKRPTVKVALISALAATVLWKLAVLLFGFYIEHAVTITRIYGAYALIVIVGLWVYYSALVFIIGAEIGQLYRERQLT